MTPLRTILVTTVCVLIASAVTATAATKLITGRHIKNGTIRMVDLAPDVRAKITKRNGDGTGASSPEVKIVSGVIADGVMDPLRVVCPEGLRAVSAGESWAYGGVAGPGVTPSTMRSSLPSATNPSEWSFVPGDVSHSGVEVRVVYLG